MSSAAFLVPQNAHIVGGWDFAKDPTGSLQRFTRPLAGFRRAYFYWEE